MLGWATAAPGATPAVTGPAFHAKPLEPHARLEPDPHVAPFVAHGTPAFAPPPNAEIPPFLRSRVQPGDVLVLMSSGAFGGLPESLLASLTS